MLIFKVSSCGLLASANFPLPYEKNWNLEARRTAWFVSSQRETSVTISPRQKRLPDQRIRLCWERVGNTLAPAVRLLCACFVSPRKHWLYTERNISGNSQKCSNDRDWRKHRTDHSIRTQARAHVDSVLRSDDPLFAVRTSLL